MDTVALLCGGFSRESVISYRSAAMVASALKGVNLYKINVTAEDWFYEEDGIRYSVNKADFSLSLKGKQIYFDYVYNFIHGTPGEDGELSGYFNLLNIKQSGSNVLPSALTFNKGKCNGFLKSHGLKVASSNVIEKGEDYQKILPKISYPCFVKPNKGGSSLGNSKVESEDDILKALDLAFEHDDEIIVEDFISGREFTCGVVEYKGELIALAVAEVIVNNDSFFDFDQKYADNGALEVIPADISKEWEEEMMETTKKVFKLLQLNNMARVDFIHTGEKLMLIEVNTIPGFSEKSFLPQMLAYKGIDVNELLTSFRK